MSEPADVLVDREIVDDNPSVAGDRRRLRDALGGVDAAAVDDALLVMTELVENAYHHADGPRRLTG